MELFSNVLQFIEVKRSWRAGFDQILTSVGSETDTFGNGYFYFSFSSKSCLEQLLVSQQGIVYIALCEKACIFVLSDNKSQTQL